MPPAAGRPTVLLLGASGFLGPALQQAFAPGEALATHCRHPRECSVFFDACATPIADLIGQGEIRSRAAIVLFATTAIDTCARDPVGTAEINVGAAIRTIDQLQEMGVKPVFVSSDAVFDGSRAMWREDDEANPILTYGRQKLEVERYVAALPAPWLIVRLPKLLSPAADPRCMLTGWCEALGRSGTIRCAVDQFFTPAAVDDAARAIAALVRTDAQGLYHIGGPRRLGRYELLGALLAVYRRYLPVHAEVAECSLRDLPFVEPRPLDTSLDSSRYAAGRRGLFRDPDEIVRAAVKAYAAR